MAALNSRNGSARISVFRCSMDTALAAGLEDFVVSIRLNPAKFGALVTAHEGGADHRLTGYLRAVLRHSEIERI